MRVDRIKSTWGRNTARLPGAFLRNREILGSHLTQVQAKMEKSKDFIVVMRVWKKWSVGMGLILIEIFAMTPLSIAKATEESAVANEETDFEPLQQGGIGSGISENLNPWEVEEQRENDYEYPLEAESTRTNQNLAPNSSDNNWFNSDTNNPRQRSGTIPFIRF